jgi:hypothetical protein
VIPNVLYQLLLWIGIVYHCITIEKKIFGWSIATSSYFQGPLFYSETFSVVAKQSSARIDSDCHLSHLVVTLSVHHGPKDASSR